MDEEEEMEEDEEEEMEEVDEEMGVAQPDTPDNSAFKSESARALLSTFLHLFIFLDFLRNPRR